jgi:hypothetical protein
MPILCQKHELMCATESTRGEIVNFVIHVHVSLPCWEYLTAEVDRTRPSQCRPAVVIPSANHIVLRVHCLV